MVSDVVERLIKSCELLQRSPIHDLCVCSRDDILSERRGDVCIDCKVDGVWANAPKDEPEWP